MIRIEQTCKKWIKNNGFSYFLLTLVCVLSECSFVLFMWILGKYFEFLQTNSKIILFSYRITISGLYMIICLLLITYIASSIIFKHLNFKLSNKNMIFLESQVLERLLDKKYESICYRNKIELAQQINNDCVIVSDFIIEKIPTLLVKTFKLILLLVLLSTISFEIFVTVLLTNLLFVILYLITRKRYKELNIILNEKRMNYFGVLGGELLNIFLVKVNVWNKKTISKFDKVGDEFVESSVKFLNIDNIINNMFFMISTIMSIIVPFVYIRTREKIIYLIIVIFIINIYYPTCDCIFQIIKNFSVFDNAKIRINRLFKLEDEKIGLTKLKESISQIKSTNLIYKYEAADKPIIRDFDFNLKKGKLYLVKGENGSGKSTFLKILMGILYSEDTKFYVNNIPSSEIDFKFLRKERISYCEQEPYIITGTFKENILYNSSMKDLDKYREFVTNLFDHLKIKEDTILYETNLSGGEKQKISILRTLYKDADMYIFDEPTASLDFQSGKRLKKIIEELLKENKLVIIISHDDTFDDLTTEIIEFSK